MGSDRGEKSGYHHGDLRTALLAAAEQELSEFGTEGFSLRRVAKRAGVSHAAPAHHFIDTGGMLTALAAVGFRRFLSTQTRRQAAAGDDPLAQLVAAGLGYIQFARENPALFRLIFSSNRPDHANPELCAAATAAYEHLVGNVSALAAVRADRANPPLYRNVSTAWALVHGIADLSIAGRLTRLNALPESEREQEIEAMLRRAFEA